MKIIHTADIHLGQNLYQNYSREDEHAFFFAQLENICIEHQPDVLIVAGDIFDIQQPSANVWGAFDRVFTSLRRAVPDMAIIIIAGNHDSASRIDSHRRVWQMINAHLIGHYGEAISKSLSDRDSSYGEAISKSLSDRDASYGEAISKSLQNRYIVPLPTGFIIALPYTPSPRTELTQALLDYVAEHNPDNLPVVLTGHAAVAGGDFEGHDFDVGRVRLQPLSSFGTGWDYLALGHIHKPQTIVNSDNDHTHGGPQYGEAISKSLQYPAPVARYSGSSLHVSADERYPHSVSLVEIDKHGGDVHITPIRINQLRHFYILPQEGCAATADEALETLRKFAEEGGRGYFRFSVDADAQLPSDFNQRVYDIIAPYGTELRYNPKIIWSGAKSEATSTVHPKFEVADIQQMTHPLQFIEATIDNYPEFTLDELRQAFAEIEKMIND